MASFREILANNGIIGSDDFKKILEFIDMAESLKKIADEKSEIAHTHAISDIVNLQTQLDRRAMKADFDALVARVASLEAEKVR